MTSNDIIALTKRLIAIPSTNDNPAALKEALEVLEAVVRQHTDITIEQFSRHDKHSFLAYRGKTRPKKFDIILNAHLDVVSGNPSQFKPQVRGGRLYGRGALDMKGTAAVLTAVFCELVNEVPYALGLQIVTDEEIGGYDGVRLQIDQGVQAKFVIMGEYSNTRGTIYNAARGLCWAEIKFKGQTAHGGHLWHGSNAVVKAGDFAGALLRRYPTPDKETWTTTASIANLYTPNEVYNKVPDSAVLKIDFRFTQEDPVFNSRESLKAFIAELDPEAELVNLATFEPAVNVEELNPYVQGLSDAMQSVSKTKPQFLGRPGASDGRHYALIDNDIIEFGLYGAGSHADDEFVELESFDEYRSIMQAFLRKPLLVSAASPIATPGANRPEYIWYATYGSGLSREHFLCFVKGGKPKGARQSYPGCIDTSEPLEDRFISLPYASYFAGESKTWGGGMTFLEPQPDPKAHTISRAYLIKTSQFEDITAQQNGREKAVTLPLKAAIENGTAIIGDGRGNYDQLIYAGEKKGYPIFTITAAKPMRPLVAPSPAYTAILCKGLAQDKKINTQTAIDYMLAQASIATQYQQKDLAKFFKETGADD